MVSRRHSTSAVVLPAVLVFFDQASLVYARARHGKKAKKADAAMSDKKVDAGEKEHPVVVDTSVDAAAESNDASVKDTNSSVVATVPRQASKSANRRKRSKHSKIDSLPPAAGAVEERRQQQHVQSQQRPITEQERPIDLDNRDDEDDVSQGSASDPAVGSTDDVAVVGGGGVAVDAEALGVLSEHRGTDENNSKEAEAEGSKECTETGPCVWCGSDELELEYCKETGRRQEVRCTEPLAGVAAAGGNGAGGGGMGVMRSSITYRSCAHSEEDDITGLLHFWLAMVVVGALACFGMRKRQQRGGSLYDRRAK